MGVTATPCAIGINGFELSSEFKQRCRKLPVWRRLLTQRRKGAKRCRVSKVFLCAFAPLREKSFLAFRRAKQFDAKHVMSTFWKKQIERADYLAAESSGSKELLTFYAQLLRAQEGIYESLRSRKDWLPSGQLESDLPVVQLSMTGLVETVVSHGPESLAAEAQALLTAAPDVVAQELLDYWHNPSDTRFFAKALLQPYA